CSFARVSSGGQWLVDRSTAGTLCARLACGTRWFGGRVYGISMCAQGASGTRWSVDGSTAFPYALASPAAPLALPRAPSTRQGGGILGAEPDHDPAVVGEHAQRHHRPERPVDLVVDADREDVPAEDLLGHLPEATRENGAPDHRADAHVAVRKVAVGHEEEH